MTLKSFIPCFSSYLGELCVSYGVIFLLKVAFVSMQHKIVSDSGPELFWFIPTPDLNYISKLLTRAV